MRRTEPPGYEEEFWALTVCERCGGPIQFLQPVEGGIARMRHRQCVPFRWYEAN